MELLHKTIRVENGQDVYIAPLGDIQWTGKPGAIASDMLRDHIKYANKLGAYYLGTGDLVDFMSPSNRSRLKKAELYDNAEDIIVEKTTELTDQLYEKYLEPTTGKWLGAVHGHHWGECEGGETSDQRLMRKLGGAFLGTSAFVVLDFVSDDDSERKGRVTLWVHHGCGNGKASAPVNKLENISTHWVADIFVIGHMSKLASAAIDRVYPIVEGDGEARFSHRKLLLVGAGSWSKAYELGHKRNGRVDGCYVEKAMLNPAALGGAMIRINTKWEQRRWSPTLKVEI